MRVACIRALKQGFGEFSDGLTSTPYALEHYLDSVSAAAVTKKQYYIEYVK